MAALQRGDFAAAKIEFASAVHADPQAGPLWRNLAHACRQDGDDAGERAALDSALALDRLDFAALLRSAELHQRRGEHGSALAAWSGLTQLVDAMAAPPAPVAAALDLGRRYMAEQQAKLAAQVEADLGPRIDAMEPTARRRSRAFVEAAMGRRAVYANQCHGLYYPFLPPDEFFDDHHFSWFGKLSAAAPAVRAELETLLARGDLPLRPYVQFEPGTPTSKWTALDGSSDWSACFLWEYGVPNQPVLEACPETAALLAQIPLAQVAGRTPNAFFSLLRPNTRIPPHTGVSNTRAIVHLPLIVPPGCGFRVGGETREWIEGEPFAFDDTIEHEAWNESEDLRAVLIFDVWNPHLSQPERDSVAAYYASADATGLNPERREI